MIPAFTLVFVLMTLLLSILNFDLVRPFRQGLRDPFGSSFFRPFVPRPAPPCFQIRSDLHGLLLSHPLNAVPMPLVNAPNGIAPQIA